MNESAVKALTRMGCIVEKEAAEELEDQDIDLIEGLDTPPMYLTVKMLENLRTSDVIEGLEYVEVKFLNSVPEFIGTDIETYGPFNEGDTVELPEDNAEILINRGNAKRKVVTDMEEEMDCIKNDHSLFLNDLPENHRLKQLWEKYSTAHRKIKYGTKPCELSEDMQWLVESGRNFGTSEGPTLYERIAEEIHE